MPGPAARTVPAGQMVKQRDANAVGPPRHDLVAKDGARRREPDLLDVRAAQSAREDAHRRAGRLGRRGEPRLSFCIEHDRAHVRIVGIPSPSE